MITKILCTADNHIGFRQYGLAKREEDIQVGFSRVVQAAMTQKAAAITVSGDILHSTRPSPATMQFMSEMHRCLKAQSIPCYVSSGNHDLSAPHWISMLAESADHREGGFHLIDNKSVQVGDMTIYGQPFVSKSEWNKIKQSIPAVDLLLMHQSFSSWAFNNPDTTFTPDDVNDLDVGMIIMGDTHVIEDIETMREHASIREQRGSYLRVSSPGSTELISASEEGDKRVVRINFDPERDKGMEFVTSSFWLDTRPVIKNLIRTDAQFQELVHEILPGSPWRMGKRDTRTPMLFLDYGPEITDIVPRLRRRMATEVPEGDELIIRARPEQLDNISEKELSTASKSSDTIDKAQILEKLLPKNGVKLNSLAHQLLGGCNCNLTIDHYVKERTEECLREL